MDRVLTKGNCNASPLSGGAVPPVLLLLFTLITPLLSHAAVDPSRQAELIYLLKHDCGSCHGMTLRGGLGPSLTPQQLRGWSPEQLATTILFGRPGTPMPPWRPYLSDADAYWLAQQLKKGIAQ